MSKMTKEDVRKVLEAKDRIEDRVVNDEMGDVGDYSLKEWIDMVCEELGVENA